MDSCPADWLPHGFFRKPAWRWLRACFIIENQQPADARLDDDWIAYAQQFQAAEAQFSEPDSVLPSDECWRAIHGAREIWQDDESSRRVLLESYFLTDVLIDRVAAACCIPVAIVEAFGALFFDVRSRLAARDWILFHAIDGRASNHFGDGPVGTVWRYAAYTGGVAVLETVIAVTTGSPLPRSVMESFADPSRDEARLRLQVKLFLAAFSATSAVDWKELEGMYEQLRRPDMGPSDARVESAIDVILDDVRYGDIAKRAPATSSGPLTVGSDLSPPERRLAAAG